MPRRMGAGGPLGECLRRAVAARVAELLARNGAVTERHTMVAKSATA